MKKIYGDKTSFYVQEKKKNFISRFGIKIANETIGGIENHANMVEIWSVNDSQNCIIISCGNGSSGHIWATKTTQIKIWGWQKVQKMWGSSNQQFNLYL